MLRRRFKQTQSLKQRLVEQVKRLREEAKLKGPGVERETLLARPDSDRVGLSLCRGCGLAANCSLWNRWPDICILGSEPLAV
jgi:hypothetical protein